MTISFKGIRSSYDKDGGHIFYKGKRVDTGSLGILSIKELTELCGELPADFKSRLYFENRIIFDKMTISKEEEIEIGGVTYYKEEISRLNHELKYIEKEKISFQKKIWQLENRAKKK